MAPIANDVIEQTIVLSMFCRQLNIPFEVYAFSDGYHACSLFNRYAYDHPTTKAPAVKINPKENDMVVGTFCLMNFLSSSMTPGEFKKRAGELYNITVAQAEGYDRRSSNLPGGSNTVRSVPDMMGMNGTPLDEAIVALYDIIPQFQQSKKIEIVNAIVLTDGAGNGGMKKHKYKGIKPINVNATNGLIVTNPGTHTNTDMSTVTTDFTGFLISQLKDMTGCNTIGYYLVNDEYTAEQYAKNTGAGKETAKKLMEDFKNTGCMRVTTAGYDSYFILDITKVNVLAANVALDANDVAKSLSQRAERNKARKVFLTQFTEIISGKWSKYKKTKDIKKQTN
jgi:hypothetical protein